jgi:hypothetical protein
MEKRSFNQIRCDNKNTSIEPVPKSNGRKM